MNKLSGSIVAIEVSGEMSLVTVGLKADLRLKAIVLETPASASYLAVGESVHLLFKETEVVIGNQEDHAVSMQNRIKGKVKKIESGKLISKLTIDSPQGDILSVISTNAVRQLGLEQNSPVTAMIKLNEMMLTE